MSKSRKVRRGEEGYQALVAHRKNLRRGRRRTKSLGLEVSPSSAPSHEATAAGEAQAVLDSFEQCLKVLRATGAGDTKESDLLAEAVAKTEKSLTEVRALMDRALGPVSAASATASRGVAKRITKEWNRECHEHLKSIPTQTRGTFVGEPTARVYLEEEGVATDNATNVRHDFRISLDEETWSALDTKISVGESRPGKCRWQFFHLDPDKSDVFFLIGTSTAGVSGWMVPVSVLEDILEHKSHLDTEGLVVCREDNEKYRGNLAVKITVNCNPVLLEPYKVKGEKLAELLIDMMHVYDTQ